MEFPAGITNCTEYLHPNIQKTSKIALWFLINRHPVTAIGALQNGRVVASFGTGHLRVFNAETGDLIYSIGAHARWITAMDVCPAMDFVSIAFVQSIILVKVITAAEDGYIFVWKIDKEVSEHFMANCKR